MGLERRLTVPPSPYNEDGPSRPLLQLLPLKAYVLPREAPRLPDSAPAWEVAYWRRRVVRRKR